MVISTSVLSEQDLSLLFPEQASLLTDWEREILLHTPAALIHPALHPASITTSHLWAQGMDRDMSTHLSEVGPRPEVLRGGGTGISLSVQKVIVSRLEFGVY